MHFRFYKTSTKRTQPSQPTNGSENVEQVNEDPTEDSKKRQKRLTSKVWQDFEKIKGSNGEDLARCLRCTRSFVRESSKGTSHLLKHQKNCPGKHKDLRQ